jgi:MFS family permease
VEFPEEDSQLQKRKRQKQFWVVAALIQIVYLISVLTLYYLNYIDFGKLVLYTILFIGAIGLAYLGYRVQNGTLALVKDEKKRFKIAYMILGGMIGLVTAFFGPIIIILLTRFFGGPDLAHDEGGELWVFLIVIGPIIGAILSYYVGKRKNFNPPSWLK